MTLAVAFAAGLLGAVVLWRTAAPIMAAEVFTRRNYRDQELPTAGGLLLALVVVGVDAVWTTVEHFAGWDPTAADHIRHLSVMCALAMALLGLLDDIAGAGESFGFRGHLRALASGRLTTGAVKLFGGGAVGLLVATSLAGLASTSMPSSAQVVADGALIALLANLANLFDRAPGRTIKVCLLVGAVAVIAVGSDPALQLPVVALGAAAGLLVPDLRERVMIGDTGSNLLGGLLGVGFVATTAPSTRLGILAVVVALNLASERVSFSQVIARTGPLRVLDLWGRTRP